MFILICFLFSSRIFMKKVLGLLFISSSIFSMQLNIIEKNCLKIKAIQHNLTKLHYPKLDTVKSHFPKLDVIKQRTQSSSGDIKDYIKSSSFSAPKGLGDIKLFHNEKGFHVFHNDKMHRVQPCFTDKLVRKATSYDIKDFQKVGNGYFAITQMGDGQFELKVLNRTLGGGPFLGIAVYWTVKIVLYAAGAVGLGAATATAGPAVAGAGGAIAGGVGTGSALAG